MGRLLLIVTTGLSTVFAGIMFTMSSNIQRSSGKIVSQYQQIIRRNTLESATNVAISRLQQDINWQSGFSDLSFSDANYSVTITDITQDSTIEAKRIQVTAVTTYSGLSDTTKTIFMQPAYSYYYLYSRKWPSHLTFENGDTLSHPIHSNEGIRMSGTPVFLGKVSSQASTFETVGTAHPKFYGGADFGNGGIPEPSLSALMASALAGGDVYSEKLWLTFNADGSYQCSTGTVLTTKFISDYNGIVMTTNDKDIHVKGTVNGKVTVVSDDDLFIDGDIVYNQDPRVHPNSPDYTGLIARDDIIVSDNAANADGVNIHAALLSLDKIKVEDHDEGAPRNTMLILGSIVQESSDEFGEFSGSTLISGYETVHIYDTRLFDRTPPFFPRLNFVVMTFRSD